MKIELDFENKFITINDDINVGELVKLCKKHNIDLKEWTLKPYSVITTYPVYPIYPQPYEQPSQPFYYTTGDTANAENTQHSLTTLN